MKYYLSVFLFLAFSGSGIFCEVTFDSSFESGNGTAFTEVAPNHYSFKIERDTKSGDRRWFYFRADGGAGETIQFDLLDSDATNYPAHWDNAWPVRSEDGGATWAHVTGPCDNDGFTFSFSHEIKSESTLFASHFPYPLSRIQKKIEGWSAHPDVTARNIGLSVQRRPLTQLTVTSSGAKSHENKMGVWVLARQHPAEVPGSFALEGLMDFLLSDNPDAEALRKKAVINVIPVMNPDGVIIGNYRDNAAGQNLNRRWNGSANAQNSPEVMYAQRAIQHWVDAGNDYTFFIDLHSISGPRPHFAYHAGERISSAEYKAEVDRFLGLVNEGAPHFDNKRGITELVDTRVALHAQRETYGVYAFTFEGGTNLKEAGPDADQRFQMHDHRAIGEAIAKALLAF